ncbi:MAG: TonB-dependent receptor plug domain-containing protein [Gemmatimonadetes bacterium]|nr:TonB-dependent receptor plug domain-containing protein [Gemmatimonadota bacterium]
MPSPSRTTQPLLLVAGAAGTVLMPWNPFSWALLARLRLAIEVDCDQRVLRLGASTGRYGRLLIDLAAAAPRLPLSAPAFSYHTIHLERRLRTMTTPAPRHRGARRLSLLATGALALVTACESQLPTAAEVERMDVAALEARTAAALPSGADGPVRFFLNGREITEAEAKALPAGKIATFVMTKSDKAREVRISTEGDTMRVVRGVRMEARQLDSSILVGMPLDSARRGGMMVLGDSALVLLERGDAALAAVPGKPVTVEFRRRVGGDTGTVEVVEQVGTIVTGTAQPLLIVDGVRQPQEALKRLLPDAIKSIEVIKGATASKLYGPDGANGVIVVTTKGKK